MMLRATAFIARMLRLQLPPELDILAAFVGTARPGERIPPMLYILTTLRGLSATYYTVCIKQIIVSITIVNSVLRALARQEISPDCTPLPWGIGVMSMFCGLASITLSFSYGSQFRLEALDNRRLLIWFQNAQRNATSPWKNISTLLAAPSILCIWSIALYVIHVATSIGTDCQTSHSPINGYGNSDDPNSLPDLISRPSAMIDPRVVKAVVIICAFVLWTYTVHALKAFAQLHSSPSPRTFVGQV